MHAHLTDSVKSTYKKASVIIAIIPGGLTKILHPLNITIVHFNEKCKNVRKEWMHNKTHSFIKTGYMRKAMYEEVAEWVSDSWKKVKTIIIASGLRESHHHL